MIKTFYTEKIAPLLKNNIVTSFILAVVFTYLYVFKYKGMGIANLGDEIVLWSFFKIQMIVISGQCLLVLMFSNQEQNYKHLKPFQGTLMASLGVSIFYIARDLF